MQSHQYGESYRKAALENLNKHMYATGCRGPRHLRMLPIYCVCYMSDTMQRIAQIDEEPWTDYGRASLNTSWSSDASVVDPSAWANYGQTRERSPRRWT